MQSEELYSTSFLLPDFDIKFGGSAPPQEMLNDMLDIVVEDSFHLPSACTIRLNSWDMENNKFKWDGHSMLQPGQAVEVKLGYVNKLEKVFEGEITALEMDASAHMTPTLILRCVDKAHRLHRNRVQKTYQDVTDSDVVSTVAGRNGLGTDVTSTTAVHKWICQDNQTDYEFLKMLADRNGFRVFVSGNTLHFEAVGEASGSDAVAEWGMNVRSFRPRLTTHGQVQEVTVRGWDPSKKQGIIGKALHDAATKTRSISESKTGYALSSDFGDAKQVMVDWPIHSQAEADSLAKSFMEKRESSSIEADGLCVGQTNIKAGKTIDVKGVGDKFSGKYVVTSATHTFTPAEGYTTQFVCSGKSPNTFLGLLDGETGHKNDRINNIVIAIVTDNVDPENLGRIKVRYPWFADDQTSDWARIVSPMAGPDRGFYFLPEVDDEVLIAFEHGDMHRPYMLGALWNGVDKPVEPNDKATSGGKVVHRVIQTRKKHNLMLDDTDNEEKIKFTTMSGHYILCDDSSGAEKVEIKTKRGHYILLDDAGKKIVIQDSSGTEKITIDDSAHTIEVLCQSDFTLKAQGKILMEAQMGIDIKTPMKIKIDGQAGATVTTTAQLSLSGEASAELKSSGIVTIKGSLVKIN
jgi:phage protein D